MFSVAFKCPKFVGKTHKTFYTRDEAKTWILSGFGQTMVSKNARYEIVENGNHILLTLDGKIIDSAEIEVI